LRGDGRAGQRRGAKRQAIITRPTRDGDFTFCVLEVAANQRQSETGRFSRSPLDPTAKPSRGVSILAKVFVRASIARSQIDVFALVSDHEKFLSGISGTTTRILKAGTVERNGLGCLREVRVGSRIRYVEEITQWQPPNSFEYLIREASMPIRHHGSRLDFAIDQGSTNVTWQSHFDVPIPVIGWLAGQFMKRRYESAFAAMLSQARVILEGAT
jgi:hypothetical protein